jgi:hypothetical protein
MNVTAQQYRQRLMFLVGALVWTYLCMFQYGLILTLLYYLSRPICVVGMVASVFWLRSLAKRDRETTTAVALFLVVFMSAVYVYAVTAAWSAFQQ